MKKMTFTMSVIYDEEETYAGNALHAIEHEMFNIEGIRTWETDEVASWDIEYKEDDC